jgi:hypothetical protein
MFLAYCVLSLLFFAARNGFMSQLTMLFMNDKFSCWYFHVILWTLGALSASLKMRYLEAYAI